MKVRTTGEAGGLHWPYKGLIQLRLKTHERFANRKVITGCPLPGAANYLPLVTGFTRKRVCKFFHTYLITCYVFLKLVPYIFPYRLFVTPHCIHIVSSAPEMPISILVF